MTTDDQVNEAGDFVTGIDRDDPCQRNQIIIIFIALAALLLGLPAPAYGFTNPVSHTTITVTATVGEPKLTLFGYTSPSALVNLAGIGLANQTIADQTGYFSFNRIFLPLPTLHWVSPTYQSETYPELYLNAVDTLGRVSSPVILPNLPLGPYEITVGPVLLPPTLTLEKGQYLPGEQITASGQTIPNAEITIFLANNESAGGLPKLLQFLPLSLLNPKKTYAYFIPKYQIVSNNNGSFQFNLPNNQPAQKTNWRIFAAVSYLNSPSPNSNSLNFVVLDRWQWLLNQILFLWQSFKPYYFPFLILAEIAAIVLLLSKIVSKKSTKSNAKLLRQTLSVNADFDKILKRKV